MRTQKVNWQYIIQTNKKDIQGHFRQGRKRKTSWTDNFTDWNGKTFTETQALIHEKLRQFRLIYVISRGFAGDRRQNRYAAITLNLNYLEQHAYDFDSEQQREPGQRPVRYCIGLTIRKQWVQILAWQCVPYITPHTKIGVSIGLMQRTVDNLIPEGSTLNN